jgi:hypothetical protein
MNPSLNTPNTISGAFVLTPAAGKKLIGLAVAAMPEVKNARQNGRLIIANGTTTAYVAEALVGKPMRKFNYCIGLIADGMFAEDVKEDRDPMLMWRHGEQVSAPLAEFIKEFEPGDVFIKGANAVDPHGHAGGLQANPNGGSWGDVIGVLTARGVTCIVPVGLEKMIPSVLDASRLAGHFKLKYSLGSPVGLMPIVTGHVITEIQALEILSGVRASVIAAGGIAGSEGARSFVVQGTEAQLKTCFDHVTRVWKEPATERGGTVTSQPYRLPE